MEAIILTVIFTLAATFLVGFIKKALKEGELCQHCSSKPSTCKKHICG